MFNRFIRDYMYDDSGVSSFAFVLNANRTLLNLTAIIFAMIALISIGTVKSNLLSIEAICLWTLAIVSSGIFVFSDILPRNNLAKSSRIVLAKQQILDAMSECAERSDKTHCTKLHVKECGILLSKFMLSLGCADKNQDAVKFYVKDLLMDLNALDNASSILDTEARHRINVFIDLCLLKIGIQYKEVAEPWPQS